MPAAADASSLPVAGVEYKISNTATQERTFVFGIHCEHILCDRDGRGRVRPCPQGFILNEGEQRRADDQQSAVAVVLDNDNTRVDASWFRGGWYDTRSVLWQRIVASKHENREPPTDDQGHPGASATIHFSLTPDETRMLRVLFTWYVPDIGFERGVFSGHHSNTLRGEENEASIAHHRRPWYAVKYRGID